jgi:hypothetical protein
LTGKLQKNTLFLFSPSLFLFLSLFLSAFIKKKQADGKALLVIFRCFKREREKERGAGRAGKRERDEKTL